MAELIPEEIGGVQLPVDDAIPVQLSNNSTDAEITAHYCKFAVEHASQQVVTQFLNMEDTSARMLDLRTKVSNGIRTKRKLEYKRAQNSNSILMQVYGTVRPGSEACAGCQKGNGPYTTCVVIPNTTACANCTYNSGASACSFIPGNHKRSGSELSTPRKSKAIKATRAEMDFLAQIRGLKPKHVRRISNALVSVADKLESAGYRADDLINLPIQSDSDSDSHA